MCDTVLTPGEHRNMAECRFICGRVKCFTFIVISMILLNVASSIDDTNTAYKPDSQNIAEFGEAKPMRYLLYEVNPGEGFNLRRDVYMRIANLVKFLNKVEPWTLVLPPWGRLYHWRSPVDQYQIPWKTFFDLESLGRHVPVIEFVDYLKVSTEPAVDEVYYLQRYKEGWSDGKWDEKMDERDCLDKTGFVEDKAGRWHWWFWDYEDVYGKSFKCLSVQIQATAMKSFLLHNTTARSVFLVRAEELLHGDYSEWSSLWWTARRSMRFAEHLRDIGDEFRESFLQSSDGKDGTELDHDWRQMKRNHGDAIGGPYIAVHMRRQDFLYGHEGDVPSIAGTAKQIRQALKKKKLDTVFVATDAPTEEFEELKGRLKEYTVVRYEPTEQVLNKFKDGGVAIIDQWICAHARYFIGTSVSTFSFRIHEEREILGFDQQTTFNRFCGDKQTKATCEQPTKWAIKYN